MSSRKWGLVVAVLVVSLVVSACTAGQSVTVPDREVVISTETALEAQELAVSGLVAGSATLDESQFSSLLTGLLNANSGENNPVESITVWFEPGTIYLQVDVKEGVLPPAVGDKLTVAGTVAATDGVLSVDLSEASAGNYLVTGAVLAPINAQINSALAGLNLGVPIQVETTEGALTLSLAQ